MDMVAHGARATSDDLGDFRVSFPGRDPSKNLALARSEAEILELGGIAGVDSFVKG